MLEKEKSIAPWEVEWWLEGVMMPMDKSMETTDQPPIPRVMSSYVAAPWKVLYTAVGTYDTKSTGTSTFSPRSSWAMVGGGALKILPTPW